MNAPTPPKPRWYVPTPAKFLLAVLLMQGLFFLWAHYRWFWFNEWKGLTVLGTSAATLLALLLLGGWLLMARLFKAKSQFSLATLLLLVPVIAIPLGWFMREIDLAREQRETLLNIKSDAGHKGPWSNVPKFLVSTLGEEFFIDVVDMRVPGASDSDLRQIRIFTGLRSLRLDNCKATDAGLVHLRELRHLRTLVIVESRENDPPHITDAGLAHLRGLGQLQKLNLFETGISDRGLEHLGSLHQLKELYLTGSSDVTDAGIEKLQGLTHLEWLGLSHTSVTDAGLERIPGFTQLVWLEIAGTSITDAGVTKFKAALPNCDVFRNAEFIRAPGRTVRVRL